MDADTLKEIELRLIKEQIDIRPYAGNAFFEDDEKEMKFWKGQYIALERMRKWVAEKYLHLAMEADKKKDRSFAEHVRERMETLKDYDHELFEEVVQGLVRFGWKEEGGSGVYRMLSRGGASIKIFRNEDVPETIKVCWTAPPEDED